MFVLVGILFIVIGSFYGNPRTLQRHVWRLLQPVERSERERGKGSFERSRGRPWHSELLLHVFTLHLHKVFTLHLNQVFARMNVKQVAGERATGLQALLRVRSKGEVAAHFSQLNEQKLLDWKIWCNAMSKPAQSFCLRCDNSVIYWDTVETWI